jgi:hypothetical protein
MKEIKDISKWKDIHAPGLEKSMSKMLIQPRTF